MSGFLTVVTRYTARNRRKRRGWCSGTSDSPRRKNSEMMVGLPLAMPSGFYKYALKIHLSIKAEAIWESMHSNLHHWLKSYFVTLWEGTLTWGSKGKKVWDCVVIRECGAGELRPLL